MCYDFVCTEGLRDSDRRRFNPSSNAIELDFSDSGNTCKVWNHIEKFVGLELEPSVRDLTELASALYMADRCSPRGEELDSNRQIRILVPVRERRTLNMALNNIRVAIMNLRCDDVSIHFSDRTCRDIEYELREPIETDSDCIALLSGGMDSLAGAAYAIAAEKLNPLLVSYYTNDKQTQISLKKALENATKREILHLQIPNIRPKGRNFTDARMLPDKEENTQRLRSFFFGTLAIAVASALDIRNVRMVDNAIMTAAIPMNPARVGPYRTRTTHPFFLRSLEDIANDIVPLNLSIVNSMKYRPKSDIAKILDHYDLSEAMARSISCSRPTYARWKQAKQCGCCIPCMLRRLALMAANLGSIEPPDSYSHDFLDLESLPESGRVDLVDLVSFCGEMAGRSIGDLAIDYPDFHGFSLDADEVERIIEVHKAFGVEVLEILRTHGSRTFRKTLCI